MHSNLSGVSSGTKQWYTRKENRFDVHWIYPFDWPAVCLDFSGTQYNFTVCFAESKSSTFAMNTSTCQRPAVRRRWNMRRSSGHVWRSPQRLWWDLPPIGHHFLLVLLKILQRSDLTAILCTAHNSSNALMFHWCACFVVNAIIVSTGTWILTSYLNWYTLGSGCYWDWCVVTCLCFFIRTKTCYVVTENGLKWGRYPVSCISLGF